MLNHMFRKHKNGENENNGFPPPPPLILNHPREHVWNSLKDMKFLTVSAPCRMLRALKRCCHLVEQESTLFTSRKKKKELYYLSLLVIVLNEKVLCVGREGVRSTQPKGWGCAGKDPRSERASLPSSFSKLSISPLISSFSLPIPCARCTFFPFFLRDWWFTHYLASKTHGFCKMQWFIVL